MKYLWALNASSPGAAFMRVELPSGAWRDVLTGRGVDGGEHLVADLWRPFPVALLGRDST